MQLINSGGVLYNFLGAGLDPSFVFIITGYGVNVYFHHHIQWLKCRWTPGNAVRARPIIDIQRSHTSNFIKTPRNGRLSRTNGNVRWPA